MEDEIGHTQRTLRRLYAYYWFFAMLLLIYGESGACAYEGILADDVRAVYFFESIVILLTAVCVPVGLKLFAVRLKRSIAPCTDPSRALHLYTVWSSIRLLLLALPLLTGIVCYHSCQSSTGLLCAAISLLASLLCIPGTTRIRNDLNIGRNDE